MKIALLADVHANIFALRSVFEDLNKSDVGKILVAGDLVGYYYWPSEVINFLMSDDRVICIQGNHEGILQEVLNNEKSAKHYIRKYGSGYEACRQQLTVEQKQWLFSLPNEVSFAVDDIRIYVGHGALGSADEYIYPDASLDKLLKNYTESDFTVFGHTHYPFIHEHNRRFLLNPGSVGQPRDAGGLASYAIINSDNRVVQFKRKSFDTESILRAVQENDPDISYLADIMRR